MPPSEQFQQDPESSYPYGVYTGVQQPQPGEPSQNFGERAWRENSYSQRNEGMPEMHYQQQIYHEQPQYAQPQQAQPLVSTYAALLPEGRFFATLSYALCWFSGLVMLFFCWQNRFIRFHALQSLVFFGIVNVFDIVMLRAGFFIGHTYLFHFWIFPMFLLTLLVNAIAGIAWLVCMVQAGLGNYYRLPIIGDIIMRKYVSQGPVK